MWTPATALDTVAVSFFAMTRKEQYDNLARIKDHPDYEAHFQEQRVAHRALRSAVPSNRAEISDSEGASSTIQSAQPPAAENARLRALLEQALNSWDGTLSDAEEMSKELELYDELLGDSIALLRVLKASNDHAFQALARITAAVLSKHLGDGQLRPPFVGQGVKDVPDDQPQLDPGHTGERSEAASPAPSTSQHPSVSGTSMFRRRRELHVPEDEFEVFIREKLDDDVLRDFARVNHYEHYEPQLSTVGKSVEDIERVFRVLSEYETRGG